MKKKILIFSLDYLPGNISGAEAAIKEITDRIPPEEIEFHMVTLYYNSQTPRVEQIGNVRIHRVGIFSKENPDLSDRGRFPLHLNKYFYQGWAGIKAWMLFRKEKYDLVWGVMAHGTGVPAVIFKWLVPNIPYALTLQEGDPPEHIENMVRPMWPIWKRCFRKATIIQSISQFLADWAKRREATCEIKIIRNGANPQSINPTYESSEIEALKEKLNKKEGDVFLTNTARLVHQKGFDTTIRALKLLPENIKLIVVGDGNERADLEKLVHELELNDRVIFTGHIDRSEVTKYRLVSDIFVGPSRSEGLGNAFLSAMACRMPVIATQVGGIADFLFDKDRNPDKAPTGFAVDPDNPEQIAKKVEYIRAHPDEVSTVVKNAREMVVGEYDWDTIAKRMKEEIFLAYAM